MNLSRFYRLLFAASLLSILALALWLSSTAPLHVTQDAIRFEETR